MTKINIREIALLSIIEIMEKGKMSHLVLAQVLKKYQYLEKQDRAFLSRLVEGTIERIITLDYILNQFSSVPTEKMKPVIRNILRLSLYQILYMDGVPESAACNEAVKLAEKKGFKNLKGFVNGILRTIERRKDSIQYPDEKKEGTWYLSVFYSTPEWIIKQWIEQYGIEKARKMLEVSYKEERGISVRCNIEKRTKEEIRQMLEKEGVVVEECSYPDYALRISGYDYLEGLEAFREGFISVQDINSMMAAEKCGVKKGDFVLDVCAAPGGKSIHIAEKLNSTGHVEARDLSKNKVNFIQENIERSGLKNIEAVVQDALVLTEKDENRADIVIADLPCSGLGVIGKKNDLKYKMTEETQKELKQLQQKILSVVWRYVKKGGILFYSTCTVNKKENEENTEWFLKEYPFELEESRTFLQGIDDGDGFYFARFRKKE
ncbi:MAG: 16S rRNA (cytosine(967)-C(5))-methyltransferase RsmB [Lachnospiraceae bacterium]|jgi:16S rRNA (cytosine967-C5)-methyltransferase|nr:16S rRNA (cytosine(967)-C(5))-methyltransferase RsmB [Lachnospiraceae bacterium]